MMYFGSMRANRKVNKSYQKLSIKTDLNQLRLN